MDIAIKRLTPELAEDYVHFFDTTPHATGKEEHRCYCIWWSSADIEQESYGTVEERKALAVKYINSNNIQGYLAYHDGKVVGWCNANTKPDCYISFCWRRFMGAVHKDTADEKVKSVFCFAIAPQMRGKGIAGLLLKQVCEDARKEGYDYVEAYPNKEFINTELDFMGPVGIYEKLGFTALYEVDSSEQNGQRKLVMRKKLK